MYTELTEAAYGEGGRSGGNTGGYLPHPQNSGGNYPPLP